MQKNGSAANLIGAQEQQSSLSQLSHNRKLNLKIGDRNQKNKFESGAIGSYSIDNDYLMPQPHTVKQKGFISKYDGHS